MLSAALTAPTLSLGWTPVPAPPAGGAGNLDRRAVLAGGMLGAVSTVFSPLAASAKIDDVNPANNYYFPMAKYRYLPRILRSWIAADQLAPAALEIKDWDGMKIAYDRLEDTVTALPLFTSAVEGSRSTKRKKKSDAQKQMMAMQKEYKAAVKDLGKAVDAKDQKKAKVALDAARTSLLTYRQMARIDTEDGGCIELPLGNAQEAGHAGAPLGYVVPAFRGGGISMDYALRDGEAMMKNGVILPEYREKYQNNDVAQGKAGRGK